MNIFQFFITCKRTNNANNTTHYVKLGKKRRKSSKRNYYIISPRVMIKAIIIIKKPHKQGPLLKNNPNFLKKLGLFLGRDPLPLGSWVGN